MIILHYLMTLLSIFSLPTSSAAGPSKSSPTLRQLMIGYSELRTNLPGGRHANTATMRACVIHADGSGRRELAHSLVDNADTGTQFVGWSPDGSQAVIGRGWESAANAAWEEANKTFRFTPESWLYDSYLMDMRSYTPVNVTSVDRISFYNSGVFFWPHEPKRLGFTALIDGNSHPFSMDIDGHNKQDLTKSSSEFTYGFSSSPNGSRIAYHKSYQVYLANADGSNAVKVETGNPFNFGPTWSPDGKFVLFLSGEHHNCHPFVVNADGMGLRKLANRGGYSGSIDFLDVPDFHEGSSDVPVWSPDSRYVYYTAQVGQSVELFRVNLAPDSVPERLTNSQPDVKHYHPESSPDGGWLVYGSKRDGVRQLCVMRLSDRRETQITHYKTGYGAMWPHWRPL